VPRVSWPLSAGRPIVEIKIATPANPNERRILLADTGAGSRNSPFELILPEDDCVLFADEAGPLVALSGAYTGEFRSYFLRVEIPALQFDAKLLSVGVDRSPPSLDGIAGFCFLSRFHYGNFGDAAEFALESL
jgi:hypothetical protein